MPIFEPVIEALERANVRYVVVGGLAVVLHGHARLTADIDVALDLRPDHVRRAVASLGELGLRPRAPVDLADLASADLRARWRSEQGMEVLSLWDPNEPMRAVDVFVENPIDFDELWDRSLVVPLEGTRVRIASIPDLIGMKEAVGRPTDLEDIAALKEIQRRTDHG
ncbi:MAG: DUF6036 family nucleotidyltransferase [Actinomycetota bacterium]